MAQWIDVKDADDPRIRAYRDVRERDLVGRNGCFIAEGEVVVRVLIERSPLPVQSVLVAAPRVERLAPLLSQLTDMQPVYVLPQADMDGLVGFPIHRGLLALGGPVPALTPGRVLANAHASAPPREPICLGLIGLSNHDNMGGLLRNAAAFGVGGVLIDETCCDPFYRKAIRVSVGGALTVPLARVPDGPSMIDAFERAGYRVFALSPDGTRPVDQIPATGPKALLLGSEKHGLPGTVLSRCESVRIDTAGGLDSLNVATASGIALHSLYRA
ncbi:MAG: RNA methyltransferase [Pseudomonadota bacterium]